MMHQQKITFGLVLLMMLSGCVPQTEPGQGVEVGFSKFGTLDRTETGFLMEGNVTIGGGGSRLDAYDNVTVHLYSGDGTRLLSRSVGTLNGSLYVSLQTKNQPHYVIVDSPDFWLEPRITVRYYVWSSEHGKYGVEDATTTDDFPVEVPTNESQADSAK